jgi:hypothetical protein
MLDQASQLINEINQIQKQYVAEVGKGRRAWPRSIKERVAALDEMGLPAKGLAQQTGIPYETLILWRYKRRHEVKSESGFHEVKVVESAAAQNSESISKSLTVPKHEMAQPRLKLELRLTTPDGYRIEGLDERSVKDMLSALRQGGVHAS